MKTALEEIGFFPESELKGIAKGGSARSFLRFKDRNRGACIFCEYSAEKEENFLYAPIAEFLKDCGVRVPEVFFADTSKRILIMEDLGETDLLDFCKDISAEDAEIAYNAAINEAAKIHSRASAAFAKKPIRLMPQFDDALYAWEHGYFFENLVKGLLQVEAEKPAAEWKKLSAKLQAIPPSLVHRDFQSQNVIMQGGKAGLIDFQGLRLGLFWYDVASLLFDPYADIPTVLRIKLYNRYCEIRGLDPDENSQFFLSGAAQRLMQALGAFAFLSQRKGKKEYLSHIPTALRLLCECAQAAGLEETFKIAAACQKNLERIL